MQDSKKKMTRKPFSTFYIYSWIVMFGVTAYDWHIDFSTFTLQMGFKLLTFFNPIKATNVISILTLYQQLPPMACHLI